MLTTASRSLSSKCLLVISVFAVAWWLSHPAVALAHARLLRSNPAPGALLDASPQRIELFFSESASLDFSSITILDRARKEHSAGPLAKGAGGDGSVTASVSETLPPGTYTVIWKVVSADDGHLTAGSFAFRVRASAANPGGSTQQATLEPEQGPITPLEGTAGTTSEKGGQSNDLLRWLIRGLMLASASLLLGGTLFTLLILEPSTSHSGPCVQALWGIAGMRFARIGMVFGYILVLALLLDLVAEVATIGATDYISALSRSNVAVRLISSTSYGLAWMLKLIAALSLLALVHILWALRIRRGAGLWELAVAAGSLLLFGEALGSHAAANQSGTFLGLPFPILSDWLHLVTATAWAGGLGYMAFALFPAFRAAGISQEERRAFLGRSIPRFSRLAVVSVVTLAITGTYNLLLHSSDLGAILGSFYGQVLALKVGVFALLVALGAFNLLRLSPGFTAKPYYNPDQGLEPTSQGDIELKSSPHSTLPSLRRNVQLEVVLVAVALVCAAGLTLLPPPNEAVGTSTSAAQQPGTTATPTPTPGGVATGPTQSPNTQPTASTATAQNEVAGYKFTLDSKTSLEGDEFILDIIKIVDASPPLTDVSKVYLKVTPQDVNAGSTRLDATPRGNADPGKQSWVANGQVLTLDGGYLVTATVQRTQSRDLKVAFLLNLSEEAGLKASAAQVVDLRLDSTPSPPISGTVTLNITLLDGLGAPIPYAKIKVLPVMPAHAHIEAQRDAKPVQGRPGVYLLPVELQMGGSWLFVFDVERNGLPLVRVDSNLDVIDSNATPTPGSPP